MNKNTFIIIIYKNTFIIIYKYFPWSRFVSYFETLEALSPLQPFPKIIEYVKFQKNFGT
jgi:hypothetical protein